MQQSARAAFAELWERNDEGAPVELVVRRRHMHQDETAVGIFANIGDRNVEIAVAIGAEVPEGFDLDRSGQK